MFHDVHLLGRSAEAMAAQLYTKSGFEILEQNYRFGACEVDLIALRGGIVHFVEVKYRKTLMDAHRALGDAQFKRISKAAEHFMSSRGELMQIDAILLDHKLQWERIPNIMIS